MRVLMTGITSFTGCHIARALTEAGYEVVGTLQGGLKGGKKLPYAQRARHEKILKSLVHQKQELKAEIGSSSP